MAAWVRPRWFWLFIFSMACLAAPVAAHSASGDRAHTPSLDPQQTSETQGRLRVYLDCRDCFSEFLRDEIDWVDFVRQPQDADVHLLSTSQGTGGGGREIVLRFVGAGRFAGQDVELRAISVTSEPENLRRETVFRTVSVGLLGYLARSGLPAGLDLDVSAAEAAQADEPPADDP